MPESVVAGPALPSGSSTWQHAAMAATKEYERRLTLRLSDSDLADVHRAARAHGTSVQRFVLDLVHEAVGRSDTTTPELDSWAAIRALQHRLATGTATAGDHAAFAEAMSENAEPTDEDRVWLDADLGGVGNVTEDAGE